MNTIEEWAARMSFLGGGGILALTIREIAGVLRKRAEVAPAVIAAHGAREGDLVQTTFAEMRQLLDRHDARERALEGTIDSMKAEMAAMKEERHALRGKLMIAEARALPLEVWAVQMRDLLIDHAIEPPPLPPGLTLNLRKTERAPA